MNVKKSDERNTTLNPPYKGPLAYNNNNNNNNNNCQGGAPEVYGF